MHGTALYLGDTVYFTATVMNPWTKQLEFLVAYAGRAVWLKRTQLADIRYTLQTAA